MRMVAGSVAMAMVAVVVVQAPTRRTGRPDGARTRRIVAEERTLLGAGPGSTAGASRRVRGLEVSAAVVVVAAGVVVLLLLVAGPNSQAGGYTVGGAVRTIVVAGKERQGGRLRAGDQSAIARVSHYFAINLNCLT